MSNTIRRQSVYASNELVFLDPSVGEIDTRTGAAAERYLNSKYRRGLELVISLGLLIMLFPLLSMIAFSVRLTSPGPIMFRQLRHRQGMAQFELVKFRTMYATNDKDPTVKQATRNDPRVTPIGRLLRRTSMDELPQLISVIKGEMSLIGPRPHAIEHDFYYSNLIPYYCDRFRSRPGITGLAQVSGARGATPRVEDMRYRVDLDLLYLQQASLKLDCRILMRTVNEIFRSDAAQ